MNPTRTDLDQEEHVQRLQGQGFYGKEITRPPLVLVLAQEGTPGAALPSARGGGKYDKRSQNQWSGIDICGYL
jgi:hypothetical protein